MKMRRASKKKNQTAVAQKKEIGQSSNEEEAAEGVTSVEKVEIKDGMSAKELDSTGSKVTN